MHNQTQGISSQALLEIANTLLVQHDDYLADIKAYAVSQQGDVLVFRGPYFLDAQGLPTAKTTAVFNLFKHLAVELSPRYHLI
ncbi:YciN family protein [Pantoea allii]|uniref:YciN family protein n=1 Tax=Pantoea allii TaxID=574096 RepID=UPI001F4E5435|nr:YciN family protein [Pantoea allii]MCH9298557.1 YciN family protein [Pantoea allii]